MQIPIDRELSHNMLPSEHRTPYGNRAQKKSNKSIFYITHYLSDEDVELSCQFRKKKLQQKLINQNVQNAKFTVGPEKNQ